MKLVCRAVSAVLFCCVVSAQDPQFIDCTKVTACSCTTTDGKTIDLSPLDSGGGNARFLDINGDDGYQYSFNPCSDFTEGSTDCVDVAACQNYESGTTYYQLGNQDSVEFNKDQTRGLELITNGLSNTDQQTRYAHVQLICDNTVEEPDFKATGADPDNFLHYLFTLTSKECCPQGNGPPTKSTTVGPGPPNVHVTVSISVGTILCIVFIVVVPLYLVGGILFNHYQRGSTGVEMLPNRGFWVQLPGYIKDGGLFVIHGIKGRFSSYEST